jgi:phosphinothricin acetyltransferase
MIIRAAKQSDLNEISLIINEAILSGVANAFSSPQNLDYFQNLLDDSYSNQLPFIVATADNRLIGLSYLSPYRKGRMKLSITAEISFYVHKNHRNKGVAKALLLDISSRAKTHGIENLFGIILDTNDASIGLMKKLGFTQWAHLPNVMVAGNGRIGQVYYGINL